MEKEAEILNCGLDVGSTTVKAVVMDENNNIIWKRYERHNTRQSELVRDFLIEIIETYSFYKLSLYITGSGGRALASVLNAVYVQEVNALSFAVETRHPDAGSVIELGGQDAKVIIWKEDKKGNKSSISFMNDKCAGGTGATIDKIFSKIGLPMEQARQVQLKGQSLHHIAAKCGVFAETDVVGLVKAGVNKEEIFISLCNAVVKQNLEVLVRGNILKDKIILLGGPHTFIPVLAELWREALPETWKMHGWDPNGNDPQKQIIVPEDSHYYAATGAVLFGSGSHSNEEKKFFSGLSHIDLYIHEGRKKQLENSGTFLNGLISSKEELEDFTKQYSIPSFSPVIPAAGSTVEIYIGIDGGSTSSKLVLLNNSEVPIYKDYVLSEGNPVVDLIHMFTSLQCWIKKNNYNLKILGTGVTGYASSILKEAFTLDFSVVETVAHMRAAVKYYGNTDIICDIGGQDIKILFMKNNRVTDFKLNTQCSAGNGYFLQGMAEQFNIPVEEFAAYAFKATSAPAFNYGCAVFMEQDKVNFQQQGWSKEEIMAGLALVLPMNIWNYVVQESNISKLGKRFVLQGGTQKNLAAVKSQVDYIKKKIPDAIIHVHKYADIGGAIGAALEVMENKKGTIFPGILNSSQITFSTKNDVTTRCRFCSNRCPRTFTTINTTPELSVLFISGNGCDKGLCESPESLKKLQGQKTALKLATPDLTQVAAQYVFEDFPFDPMPEHGSLKKGFFKKRFNRSSEKEQKKRQSMVVGIPRLLNQYYYNPFFSTYLRALGIDKVVYSDYTSPKLWSEGNKWGANDPCFPAKVAPAHIYNLMKTLDLTHIMFPRVTHLPGSVENTSGDHACVIQMGTPEVVDAVFSRDKKMFLEKNIEYLKPLINLKNKVEAEASLFDYFTTKWNITRDENIHAVKAGYQAMEEYLLTMRMKGKEIIEDLIVKDKMGILIIGHPYHHDPGLNHEIPEKFQMLGYPVLTIESLPIDDEFLKPLLGEIGNREISDIWLRDFNRNLNHKIWAVKVAAKHPNLAVVDLSSFKCGFDAPAYSFLSNILDTSGTPHFLFHDIDQNKPGATFDIRIKTIDYFLKHEERSLKAYGSAKIYS
ncbi:MAG: acyl-CoA dehydratase activase-related protein [Spirochaetaceae bacterium]|jgi:predicted CoA-substrate-specific enzyme activase|nr:acyl-CoA dehydratase activase-related protein [Spirochaetaceae bacterium]